MLYQRFPAVPCDTSPTLQAKKSANNMKILGYLENRADPHNLKVTGSNPVPQPDIPSIPIPCVRNGVGYLHTGAPGQQ
jgi:hypothetical protein